jgi:tol-pal system protein YbgF
MRRWLSLIPVAALAATGCMASKADIRLLQDEVRTLRAMQSRADSARAAREAVHADSLIAVNRRTQDSLRILSQRLASFQATVAGELYEINKQLITVQELAGMSSRQISGLRASMGERAQAMTTTPTPADSGAAPQQPGPAQLFQMSFDQLRRGSPGTARAGFEELLRRYPEFEEASAAMLYIAQTYADEKKVAESDSVYGLVVTRYRTSKDAPTALFKYGLSQLAQGKTAAARNALRRVTTEYPSSTEAELARERLRTIR